MKKGSEQGSSQRSDSAKKPEVHFTEADFQAIAEELGVDCTPGLKNQLITAATNYFSIKHYWENRESTAELRADLTKIGKQAKKLCEFLENLSPLGQAVFKQGLPDFERAIGDIRRLQETAENELQLLTFGKGGPTKNAPMLMYLVMLATIYHEHTGKTPRISTDPYPWKKKYPHGGPFFHFAISNVKVVEPELVASDEAIGRIGKVIKNNLKLIKSHPK